MEYFLKDQFICNYCKTICMSCNEDLARLKQGIIDDKNKDLVDRKQEIKCLGKWCDKPCSLQDLDAVPDTDTLIKVIKYNGSLVNKLLEEKYAKKED